MTRGEQRAEEQRPDVAEEVRGAAETSLGGAVKAGMPSTVRKMATPARATRMTMPAARAMPAKITSPRRGRGFAGGRRWRSVASLGAPSTGALGCCGR